MTKHGARFLIALFATQAEAAELARSGHKQCYFVQATQALG
jgi:hypothetical protein